MLSIEIWLDELGLDYPAGSPHWDGASNNLMRVILQAIEPTMLQRQTHRWAEKRPENNWRVPVEPLRMESVKRQKARIRGAINNEIDAFDALLTGRIEELEGKLSEREPASTAAKVIHYLG